MSRKRPRNEEVDGGLHLNEDNSNNDSLLNGTSLNEDEAEYVNGEASGSGVEYSPPVVSTPQNICRNLEFYEQNSCFLFHFKKKQENFIINSNDYTAVCTLHQLQHQVA